MSVKQENIRDVEQQSSAGQSKTMQQEATVQLQDRRYALMVLDSWMAELGSSMTDGHRMGRLLTCGIFLALMMMPYQMFAGDGFFLSIIVGVISIQCGVSYRYMVMLKEDDKEISVYHKLRYLPLTKRELRHSRSRYYTKYVVRLALLAGALQFLTSLFGYHSFGWENVCYILVVAVLLPGLLLASFVYHR